MPGGWWPFRARPSWPSCPGPIWSETVFGTGWIRGRGGSGSRGARRDAHRMEPGKGDPMRARTSVTWLFFLIVAGALLGPGSRAEAQSSKAQWTVALGEEADTL